MVLVQPAFVDPLVLDELILVEEQRDFAFVRALVLVVGGMDDVAAEIEAVIPADRPGIGLQRVGRADHAADLPGRIRALQHEREIALFFDEEELVEYERIDETWLYEDH